MIAAFFKCSANRWQYDGIGNTEFKIVEEDDFNLYKNITVDLQYGQTPNPKKMCAGDYFARKKAKEFLSKIGAPPVPIKPTVKLPPPQPIDVSLDLHKDLSHDNVLKRFEMRKRLLTQEKVYF